MVYCLHCHWKGRGDDALISHWKICEKKKENDASGIKLSYLPDLVKKKIPYKMDDLGSLNLTPTKEEKC